MDAELDDVQMEVFSAFYDENMNSVIVFDDMTNGFFSLDCETGLLRGMSFIDCDEHIWGRFGYPCLLEQGLYCFPPCNKQYMIFLDNKGKMREIPVSVMESKEWSIVNAITYDNRIYLLCGKNNGIIVLDKDGNGENIYKSWINEYEKKAGRDIRQRSKSRYGNYIIEDSILTMPLLWVQSLLKVDLKTMNYKFQNVASEYTEGFLNIYDFGGTKWLISKNFNKIVSIDSENNTEMFSCDIPNDTYGRSVKMDENIVIFGFRTNKIILFNVKKKASKLFEIRIENDLGYDGEEVDYSFVTAVQKKYILAFEVHSKRCLKISSRDKWESIYFERLNLHWDEDTKEKILLNKVKKTSVVSEDQNIGLKQLLSIIQKSD